MNKFEKLSWIGSLIYSVSLLFFILLNPFSVLQLVFQLCLLGLFYLGFKKQKVICTTLSFGWLFWGSIQAIQRIFTQILPLSNEEGFGAVLAGAVITLIFMLLVTYFTLRALVGQMTHRFAKS